LRFRYYHGLLFVGAIGLLLLQQDKKQAVTSIQPSLSQSHLSQLPSQNKAHHSKSPIDKHSTLTDTQQQTTATSTPKKTNTQPNHVDHQAYATNIAAIDSVISIDKPATTIIFKEIYNDFSKNISDIDSDLIDAGKMFVGNLSVLRQHTIGTTITVDIDGLPRMGQVTKNRASKKLPNNSYVKISFENQGEYMTAYIEGDTTKGKIYTRNGSYMYENNGDTGFILSIYEYKKMHNALHID